MNNHHLFFKLFSNCIPVKGATRSIICDLHRGKIDFIPNDLYEVLTSCKGKPIREIQAIYGEENFEIIEEYIKYLVDSSFGFLCEEFELEWFSDIFYHWETPRFIENAIIDVNSTSDHPFESIFRQLEDLGCLAIQLRFFYEAELEHIQNLLAMISESRIESVDLLLKYSSSFTSEVLGKLFLRFPRILNLVLHSAPSSNLEDALKDEPVKVTVTDQKILDSNHCGFISPHYFHPTLESFMESQKHNTCLNKKISVDVNGKIKNCPSMQLDFGNVRKTTLKSVLNDKNFLKYWGINKDQISICKDCEFRYICSDCRVFIEDSNNIYSKPSKCSYNPYKGEWEEASSGEMTSYK